MTHSVSDGKKDRLHLSHKIVQKCSSSYIQLEQRIVLVNKLSFFLSTLGFYHVDCVGMQFNGDMLAL